MKKRMHVVFFILVGGWIMAVCVCVFCLYFCVSVSVSLAGGAYVCITEGGGLKRVTATADP